MSGQIFFLRGGGAVSKITADGDCSQEIQKHLLLGEKAITNLDSAETSLCQQKSMSQSYVFSSSYVRI